PKPVVTYTASSLVGNAITIGANTLVTGDVVRYEGPGIGHLADRAGYYVRVDTPTTISFYFASADAFAGVRAVQLGGSLPVGTHTFTTGVLAEVQGLQSNGIGLDIFQKVVPGDTRPWLRLIDSDKQWRETNMTMTEALFQV